MKEFLKQIVEKKFKPSNFSVYNIIEENGFIIELENNYNQKFSIDDFEYMLFDLTTKEINGIKYYMSVITNRVNALKNVIECDMQDDKKKPKAMLYVNKDKGYMFVFKLKDFDLVERVKNFIGDESTPPINED